MNYYTEVLKKYAVFTGRARRKEYWMFTLWNFIIVFILEILNVSVVILTANPNFSIVIVVLILAYGLAVIVPNIAVTVRRLHDTNHSGAWFFINFIPFIGPIITLVFTCTDSQPGDNQYGPNPKGVSQSVTVTTPTA